MIRWLKYKLTGNPLTQKERCRYDRMKEVYREDYVQLSPSEFKRFRHYWKILDRYNMEK